MGPRLTLNRTTVTAAGARDYREKRGRDAIEHAFAHCGGLAPPVNPPPRPPGRVKDARVGESRNVAALGATIVSHPTPSATHPR